MKVFFCTAVLIVGSGITPVSAQSSPIPVTIFIKNQLTGIPVDAALTWADNDAVNRTGVGKYQVVLQPQAEGILIISRDGYFDSQLKLTYDSVRKKAVHEIKLQPGIPQLNISILNEESGEQLTSVIDLFTMDESSIVFSEEVEISPYTIDLEYNKVHVLQVRSAGFFSFKDTIDYTNVFEGRTRTKTIRLVPLKTGNKISLNNIYFKQNEASLTDFARLMLVELTHILGIQKNMIIEIGAFTDDVGTDAYNLALSEKRAMAVKNYLIEKGASPKQILIKGYGENSPVAANTSEENRALNRRVEFKIVSIQ
jgi:outer membrane protein OmpA-like peptidoglycan-associated protein